MKELTLKHAVDLSVVKWEWIIKQGATYYETKDMLVANPELCGLCTGCGLCEYFGIGEGCGRCPLDGGRGYGTWCGYEFSKWVIYYNSNPQLAKKWATKLLNRLYEIQLCCEAQGVK